MPQCTGCLSRQIFLKYLKLKKPYSDLYCPGLLSGYAEQSSPVPSIILWFPGSSRLCLITTHKVLHLRGIQSKRTHSGLV